MDLEIYNKLCEIAGQQQLFCDEPMSRHTTFRIGGPAKYFLCPRCVEELRNILKLCRERQLDYFILGNGSNLLVSDQGYRGIVIQLYRNFSNVTVEGTQMHVQAGALLSTVARKALEAGLTGFEFAGGIPGTLGGGTVMNAGAYGGELKDVLKEVTVLTKEGDLRILQPSQLQMGYRTSIIKTEGYIVLEAVLQLQKGEREAIRSRMQELTQLRTSKQPLEYPSAGSTFKRPQGYFAGKLIMDAGLCGYQVGGAQVSQKHCGFVINKGGATAHDVVHLMNIVASKVEEQFGVTLEPEVKFLGDFDMEV